MTKSKLSVGVMVASVLATAVSFYVFLSGQDLFNIAGTQWILIGIALGVYGLYLVHCPCGSAGDACCQTKDQN